MANYTTADIKALREQTGAGMLDVKNALDEADGDRAKAVELLRVKGLKGVAKREGRATSNGVVVARTADGAGTLVEVACETDFVAKSAPFTTLADRVLAVAVATRATDAAALLAADADGRPLSDVVSEAAATIGEKIEVRRVAQATGAHVASYLHRTSPDLPPQLGVLIALDSAETDEIARDVAMHIAAMAPTALSREEIDEEVVSAERRVAEETAREEGKPEQALPRIVEGRVNGFFKANVLSEQAYSRDNKRTVGQVLAEAGTHVTSFARFRVGA